MSEYTPTPLTTLKRRAQRAVYDREAVAAILDEAFLCHVACQVGREPVCIPTVYARIDEVLYLHGSSANRVLRALCDGARACVTVCLMDALVVARSTFRHSVNYRSVVVYGSGREVDEPEEKDAALRAIVDQVIPGRSKDARPPNETELRQTLVVAIPLVEVSAKVKTGPPADEEDDYALPHWAGLIPLEVRAGAPVDDPRLGSGLKAPEYVRHYRRPTAEG